jgi:hypothetical protein
MIHPFKTPLEIGEPTFDSDDATLVQLVQLDGDRVDVWAFGDDQKLRAAEASDRATFICKAVNNHDALVEALIDCAAALQPSRNGEEREALAKACVLLQKLKT